MSKSMSKIHGPRPAVRSPQFMERTNVLSDMHWDHEPWNAAATFTSREFVNRFGRTQSKECDPAKNVPTPDAI